MEPLLPPFEGTTANPKPTSHQKESVFLTLSTINASLGILVYSYCTTLFNSVQTILEDHVFADASTIEISLVATGPFLGSVVGALLALSVFRKYNRRHIMIFTCAISIIGVLMTLLPNIIVLIIGRLLTGFEGGTACIYVEIYLSEISPGSKKSGLSIIQNITMAFGSLIATLLGSFSDSLVTSGYYQLGYRLFFIFPGILLLIKLINLVFVFNYDTPYRLLCHTKVDEAEKAITRLYNQETQEAILDENKPKFKENLEKIPDLFKTKKYRKPLAICAFIAITPYLVGVLIPILYSQMVYYEGIETLNSEFLQMLTNYISIINFLSSFVALLSIKLFSKRQTMMIGFAIITLINSAVVLMLFAPTDEELITKIFSMIFVVLYLLIIGPITYLHPAENLPEVGVALISTTTVVTGFIASGMFIFFKKDIGFTSVFTISTAFIATGKSKMQKLINSQEPQEEECELLQGKMEDPSEE